MKKTLKIMKGNQLQISHSFSGTYPELYDLLWGLCDYEKHYYTISGNAIRKYQWIDQPGNRGKSLSWITLANDYQELRERIKSL